MNIVIFGSGNVATHLAYALKKAEYPISQVYSPNPAHAHQLADGIGAESVNSLGAIDLEADMYIFAVKDAAIETLASRLSLQGKILIHTSGSMDIAILKPYSNHCGVLYPLQTISKEVALDFSKIPLILEYTDKKTKDELKNMAFRLSPLIFEYDSEQRRCLHLGAVLACNFSNYLYSIAYDFLMEKRVDFNLLKPLISETAHKIEDHSPNEVQTGPAIRRDTDVIQKHLHLLEHHKNWQDIYKLLSDGIMEYHKS